jgi:hypothetical protein
LDYQNRDSQFVGDVTPDDIGRQLADEAGVQLARLFHDWRKPEPGESL